MAEIQAQGGRMDPEWGGDAAFDAGDTVPLRVMEIGYAALAQSGLLDRLSPEQQALLRAFEQLPDAKKNDVAARAQNRGGMVLGRDVRLAMGITRT